MKCTVCNHPQLHDIDQALLAENATFAALSQKYGLSISALFRHKRMLQNKMRRPKNACSIPAPGNPFSIQRFLELTRQIVRTARADGDSRLVLQAIREGTRILNFITKLDVQFDPDTVYRILASPNGLPRTASCPPTQNLSPAPARPWPTISSFPARSLPPTG